MIEAKANLIRQTVEEGTGAEIALDTGTDGLQKGLALRFADLTKNGGPVVTLRPSGLRRHSTSLHFGDYSGGVVDGIARANDEQVQLARALVRSIDDTAELFLPEAMTVETWAIADPSFRMRAERKIDGDRASDEAIAETCVTVVVPIMAALAELIGYEDAAPAGPIDGALEGAVKVAIVRRRERNPRNRLLCLRIHGHACAACGIDPRDTYGPDGAVLEVHHLQPLSQIDEPRAYDPRTDLVPLCPTCHRVVHSRRLVPWTPAEVRGMMNA